MKIRSFVRIELTPEELLTFRSTGDGARTAFDQLVASLAASVPSKRRWL